MGTPDSKRVAIVEENLSVSARRRYSLITGNLNIILSKNALPLVVWRNFIIAIIIQTIKTESNKKLPLRKSLVAISILVGAGSSISKLEKISVNLGITARMKITTAIIATATKIRG